MFPRIRTATRIASATAVAAAVLVPVATAAPVPAGGERAAAKAASQERVGDVVAPRTRILGKVPRARGRGVLVFFTANERATFECRLDGGAWRICRSPVSYGAGRRVARRISVRARDRAGNIDATPSATTLTRKRPLNHKPQRRDTRKTDRAQGLAPGEPARPAPAKPAAAEPVARPVAPTASAPLVTGPGFQPLPDEVAAARVVRSSFEPRPENFAANHRVPTASELAAYHAARADDHFCESKLDLKVTGNFTGTTDEILQWGAHKWGLDADMLRAMAVVESWWKQSAGDETGGGLLSIVWRYHAGTFPLGTTSTAFNVDYLAAILRHYLDGCADWLNDVERGADYAAGDVWGSVGAWYAGRWRTSGAEWYIGRVRSAMAERTWAKPGF